MKFKIFSMEKPEHYNWEKDPKGFKKSNDGHIPHNRCFFCGSRFLGSEYAAFCNICDLYMTPDPDSWIYVVTQRPPKGTKDSSLLGEGHWTTRRQFISNRLRIPENEEEESFKKRMERLQKEQLEKEKKYDPEFHKASEVA